jgi:transposase-like protein
MRRYKTKGTTETCPKCGSTETVKNGKRYNLLSAVQRFKCLTCGKGFTQRRKYPRTRYPPRKIDEVLSLRRAGSTLLEIQCETAVPQPTALSWIRRYRGENNGNLAG